MPPGRKGGREEVGGVGGGDGEEEVPDEEGREGEP